ncbi:hypothetical protein BEL04_10060 [Mucilaginibacter sp. PPCGB 2223]|uniref:ABC transporter ATP-binding protein n=1 Tax=Mucilaginibacter sp. PPCGB 2223 TaxID=1886027 RepID=UPI000826E61F|nr:polysaccharide ABC transporter ATP-binding protein [Mucilaginibacter sp. PPCGB 2223]OCX54571.1 hypothetical protein BEL04_10060 [Mucilaginibacter sp. PPCGB 2223]
MSNSVISVQNISKQYRLGEIGTGSMVSDLNRWWHAIRGKEDPYLKIGETNDRTKAGNSDYVWSLRDINFEIEQGDAVGIIGRNGAGKSTLLKILSRVTLPTTGTAKIKGRIASLLEVGTGFHPDLSGRDNIFLNGAILGMRKDEIKRKFDEIVDFAGVERYIDTPVKRYSSGMYVRLAFAVAAHLESEILIVDEVLAVGDSEFQKKCLGKMGDVSKGEGRTVLFVSHTMSAIKQLCTHSILLNQGSVEKQGLTADVISHYLADSNQIAANSVILPEKNSALYFTYIAITDDNNDGSLLTNDIDFYVLLDFIVAEKSVNVEISVCFKNSSGVNVFFTSLSDANTGKTLDLDPGKYQAKVKIPNNFLLPDSYTIDIYAHNRGTVNLDVHQDVLKFYIEDLNSYMAFYGKAAGDFTTVLNRCEWDFSKL